MVEQAEGGSERSAELEALLGGGPIPFPEATQSSFQPWHRPRKQYVRSLQWCREINFLARDLDLNGDLRYLTLPGNDLLDIRYLGESVCTPRGLRLRYLGFNSAAKPSAEGQPALDSATFSLNRSDFIHSESTIIADDFRSVGDPRSIPWERVRRAGPFHAINLDLCGGFAGPHRMQGMPNYFGALQALLQHQRSANQDFLLFITSRMDGDSIEDEAAATLRDLAQAIHDTCDKYASGFATAWALPAGSEVVRVPEVVDSAQSFMLGLTQWIVAQGVEQGLKASVRSFMTYRTGSDQGEDDIVSLAIRFKPDPFVQSDPQGLVRTTGAELSQHEKLCEQSSIIPLRVKNRVFVDEELKTRVELFEQCMREASSLLASAGYDASAYRDWVLQEADRYAPS